MGLIFVPLSTAELQDWATTGTLAAGRPAHAATGEFQEAFGLTDAEEAEQVALLVASIAGLIANRLRLVAVVEGMPVSRPGADADFGEVTTPALSWRAVAAIFADEPEQSLVAGAAIAVAGSTLSQAWEKPAVTALLGAADLLWHGAGEWELLVAG